MWGAGAGQQRFSGRSVWKDLDRAVPRKPTSDSSEEVMLNHMVVPLSWLGPCFRCWLDMRPVRGSCQTTRFEVRRWEQA